MAAQVPIGTSRLNATLSPSRIVRNPRRQGIESERGHIVAKLRDGC